MLHRTILFSALLVVGAKTSDVEDVTARANAATRACTAPGGVPHPWDHQLLVVCGGERRLVAVVRCPEDTHASAKSGTCVPEKGGDVTSHAIYDRRHVSVEDVPGFRGNAVNEEDFLGSDEDAHKRIVHSRHRRQSTTTVGCLAGGGPRCADCDRLLVCAPAPNGGVILLANVSCSGAGDGLICDKNLHACAQGASCNVPESGGFRCLQPGSFPDAQDCQRYHLCNDRLEHFSDTCDIAYDADKALCVTEGDACDSSTTSPPDCTTNAAPAAFPGRPSFYRVCLPQSPKGYLSAILRCPDQQAFDPKAGTCAYVCDAKKVRYPDPLDCRSFYDCPGETATPTVPKKGSCSSGLAYDAKRRMCIPEANVTTCVSVSTPTPVPSVTPVTTTTTQSPADVPGKCSREGVFPDPYECRRYVVCSMANGNLVRSVRYCPLFTAYNVNAKACWLTLCI